MLFFFFNDTATTEIYTLSLHDALPICLRESLDAHGLLAKKSFGQHFLLDLNVTRKIVRLAGPLAGRVVVEVGPGPGGLTRAPLESDAEHVVAVEKDARFLPLDRKSVV